MLKTQSILTPWLILALGAWNAALRSCCRGTAGPAGGSRDWYLAGICRNSGSSGNRPGPGARPHLCTVGTPGGEWSQTAAAGAALGCRGGGGREPRPPGGHCTPWAAGSLCLPAQGPPGLCPALLLPGESLSPTVLAQLCCPGASCAQSHGKSLLSCSQSPTAKGHQAVPLALLPKEQLENAQTSDRTVPAQPLLIEREKQQQAPTCSQGISVPASSSCLPDTASWDHTLHY